MYSLRVLEVLFRDSLDNTSNPYLKVATLLRESQIFFEVYCSPDYFWLRLKIYKL
jgi:hypothetical protein